MRNNLRSSGDVCVTLYSTEAALDLLPSSRRDANSASHDWEQNRRDEEHNRRDEEHNLRAGEHIRHVEEHDRPR
jgi:hypothetical protein